MEDLIDRQAAIDAVEKWLFDTTDLRQPKEVLCCLPSAPRLHITGYIPEAWIENEIEWLRGVGNHFASLTAMNIEAMLKRWREQQESEGDKDGRGR